MNAVVSTRKIAHKIKGFRVLTPTTAAAAPAPVPLTTTDPDRRLAFRPLAGIVKGSARWINRPDLPDGNDAKTYKLVTPEAKVYVTVGHYTNGVNHPFEVFVNADAPRGLGPLPWLLSRVMRSTDRAWVRKNLRALQKVKTKPFDLRLPQGETSRVGGLVAGFAALVEYRCTELGFFDGEDGPSPMLAARMCEREPKGRARGFTTHSWDVNNTETGDDGVITLKEALTEDGTLVPLSVWFSGQFEPEWAGLAKVLSLQMQICDLSLIATTLKELEQVYERNGEYGWADVPGQDKQHYYGSTLAYIATVIRARYQTLGLFDEEGMPVQQLGLFQREDVGATQHATIEAVAVTAPSARGENCTACGDVGSVILSAGCRVCQSCGASKCS